MSKATAKKAEKISMQQAKEAMEKEKREREQECQTALQACLKKYNCALDATVTVGQRGNRTSFIITALG